MKITHTIQDTLNSRTYMVDEMEERVGDVEDNIIIDSARIDEVEEGVISVSMSLQDAIKSTKRLAASALILSIVQLVAIVTLGAIWLIR